MWKLPALTCLYVIGEFSTYQQLENANFSSRLHTIPTLDLVGPITRLREQISLHQPGLTDTTWHKLREEGRPALLTWPTANFTYSTPSTLRPVFALSMPLPILLPPWLKRHTVTLRVGFEPHSQCLSRRRHFVPLTAQSLWSAYQYNSMTTILRPMHYITTFNKPQNSTG